MAGSVQAVRLDSFFPEQMEQTVQGAALEHLPLGPGRFLADRIRGTLPAA
jgi:hypothetical protein